VKVNEKQVILSFEPSESIDVKEQFLYRKTDLKENWVQVAKLKLSDKQYIDTNIQVGLTYYYTLRAKDESNLFSKEANPVSAKAFDSGIRQPVSNLSASTVDQKIVLKWDYPRTGKDLYFVIYKRSENGELKQYARVNEKTYTDTEMGKENNYLFRVLTADGGQSVLSDVVSVKIK
jgi:hypothetical protein